MEESAAGIPAAVFLTVPMRNLFESGGVVPFALSFMLNPKPSNSSMLGVKTHQEPTFQAPFSLTNP